MRIDFERSGGFTGILMQASLDTADLPTAQAAEVHKMVTAVDFFSLPEQLGGDPAALPGADRFQYRLTISDDEHDPHTVRCGEASAPPEMQPLLRMLTLLAREQAARQREDPEDDPDDTLQL